MLHVNNGQTSRVPLPMTTSAMICVKTDDVKRANIEQARQMLRNRHDNAPFHAKNNIPPTVSEPPPTARTRRLPDYIVVELPNPAILGDGLSHR